MLRGLIIAPELGAVQNTLQEADALAQADEANHDGHDHGQQTKNLIEHTGDHFGSDDGGQLSDGGCTFHCFFLLQKKILRNL